MRELGLTAAEMIVFAIVSSYTGFRGAFSGEIAWLSTWLGTDGEKARSVLDSLVGKGLVVHSVNSYGHPVYKSACLGGTNEAYGYKYDSINPSIDPSIEEKIEKNTIDSSIDSSIERKIEETIDEKSIDCINIGGQEETSPEDPSGEKTNGSAGVTEKEKRERIIALMDEYGDITKVPLSKLEEACGKVSN